MIRGPRPVGTRSSRRPPSVSRIRILLLILALVAVGAIVGPAVNRWWAWRAFAGRDAALRPTHVDTLGTLDPVMRESSGLASSRERSGVYWTHNDSGDGPRVYAFDSSGAPLRTFEVADAQAVDWEDMDAGPCPLVGPRGPYPRCLYLADFGDNNRARDTLTVYVVAEPDLQASPDTLPLLGRLRFRYPDEPHDAELLAVSPGGDLVVVTKGRTRSVLLFTLPAPDLRAALAADRAVTLAPGRTLPIVPDGRIGRMVTGGSFRADGRELAVRTYTEVYFVPWPLGPPGGEVSRRCVLGRLDGGGEALAYLTPDTLLLTSEAVGMDPGILTRVVCP